MTARWDALPLLGAGQTGQVLRAGKWVVKVAHPDPAARARLAEEARWHRRLSKLGFPVPALKAVTHRAIVRAFVDGRPGRDPALEARLTAVMGDARPDLAASNLVKAKGRVWLLDPGPRGAPAHARAPRLLPMLLPPSGRFAVEVPLRPARGARLVWLNAGLLGRLGLDWPARWVARLAGLEVGARGAVMTGLATRYTDMIALDLKDGPRGDGRSVLLGRVGRREVSLKGAGATPLAWAGRKYHVDGRVSLPRTLWEASIADELARLGFDVPEYAAVVANGATTIDNTRQRWPAANGLRLAPTFLRLGHLRAVAHDPERKAALLAHARRVLGPGDLGLRFARTLGADAGRCDALQIHCFNPTPGNVRLDGHPLDFSTIRFFRHHADDYRVLENRFTVRQTRALWLRQVRSCAELLGRPVRSLDAVYQRAWVQGFAAGLQRFWGIPFDGRGVALALKLRAEVDGRQRFAFWGTEASAPLFDLAGAAPRLQRVLRLGLPRPWRALLRRPDAEVSARAQRLAEAWVALVRKRLARAQPRAWHEVIRPGMELEALARLCYRGTPARWRDSIASSRHLPEGTWRYAEARAWADRLGHVALPRVDGGGRETVVGLTPELFRALKRVLRRVFGKRLVGAVAHGSRVMERNEVRRRDPAAFIHGDLRLRPGDGVREYGPSMDRSSDLDLKVFVRPGPDRTDALAAAFGQLHAWFPLRVPRVIATRAATLSAAFARWNAGPRKRELGKDPIPACQAVVLCAAAVPRGRPSSPSTRASRGRTARRR